jgi:hypothetical protein
MRLHVLANTEEDSFNNKGRCSHKKNILPNSVRRWVVIPTTKFQVGE